MLRISGESLLQRGLEFSEVLLLYSGMGVMNCSRRECGAIMCDTYVPEVGYLCNECQREFLDLHQGKEDLSEGQILEELQGFVETAKRSNAKVSISEFFRMHTR
jgi:hypothetical protein